MRIVDTALEAKRALIVGIGGGGDVISTLYVKNFLEKFGVSCICGGVIWERYIRDRKPGPRAIHEIDGAERIAGTLGYLYGDEAIGSVRPIASMVAEFIGEKVLAVSIKEGVRKLRSDLKEFVEENSIDLVMGVDAGGDSIAMGSESGLVSPLADFIMLSALSEFDSILAVVGFGSDGELERESIERYLSEMHESILGAGTVEIDGRMLEFLESVESEASRIPALARTGYFGDYSFWGEKEIRVSILNSLIFYLKLRDVYERNRVARDLFNTESIEDANSILNRWGIKTELDLEYELAMRDGLL